MPDELVKRVRLDQEVQADVVCSKCLDQFDSSVHCLKANLDESLKLELESLTTRVSVIIELLFGAPDCLLFIVPRFCVSHLFNASGNSRLEDN